MVTRARDASHSWRRELRPNAVAQSRKRRGNGALEDLFCSANLSADQIGRGRPTARCCSLIFEGGACAHAHSARGARLSASAASKTSAYVAASQRSRSTNFCTLPKVLRISRSTAGHLPRTRTETAGTAQIASSDRLHPLRLLSTQGRCIGAAAFDPNQTSNFPLTNSLGGACLWQPSFRMPWRHWQALVALKDVRAPGNVLASSTPGEREAWLR